MTNLHTGTDALKERCGSVYDISSGSISDVAHSSSTDGWSSSDGCYSTQSSCISNSSSNITSNINSSISSSNNNNSCSRPMVTSGTSITMGSCITEGTDAISENISHTECRMYHTSLHKVPTCPSPLTPDVTRAMDHQHRLNLTYSLSPAKTVFHDVVHSDNFQAKRYAYQLHHH